MSAQRYFEDFELGETIDLGAVEPERMSEAAMIAFAEKYDPQPFHLDPEAGRASILGGLAASGWHTNALGMRIFYNGLIERTASLGAPGIDDCRWLKPVFPSERAGPLSGRLTVAGLRPSGSRPQMGFVGFEMTLLQRDPEAPEAGPRPVCVQRFSVMVGRRAPGEAAAGEAAAGEAASPKPAASRPPEASETIGMAEALALRSADPAAVIGKRIDLGAVAVTAEEIVAFAEQFDPQPFHLSEEAGRDSLFGGLCASGWHTTAMFMSRLVRATFEGMAAQPPERQAALAQSFGPSPGFTALRWARPVRPGDRLRFFSTATALEPFGRRADWMLMRGVMEGETETGAPVLRFNSEVLTRAAAG